MLVVSRGEVFAGCQAVGVSAFFFHNGGDGGAGCCNRVGLRNPWDLLFLKLLFPW